MPLAASEAAERKRNAEGKRMAAIGAKKQGGLAADEPSEAAPTSSTGSKGGMSIHNFLN